MIANFEPIKLQFNIQFYVYIHMFKWEIVRICGLIYMFIKFGPRLK